MGHRTVRHHSAPRSGRGVVRDERPWFRVPRIEPEVAFGEVKPALESHCDHLLASLAGASAHATPNAADGGPDHGIGVESRRRHVMVST